jgi:hypothetical protein
MSEVTDGPLGAAIRFSEKIDRVMKATTVGNSVQIWTRKGSDTKHLMTVKASTSPFETADPEFIDLLVCILNNLPRVAQFLQQE